MPPKAESKRWRPLRSGLINLFKYEEQEFLFEDGRLLLRGNNGAGKSRVLALQLPFLLDGEISSHRVEPDGDPAKRMEWNLLMGDRHDNRLGYTWIEFGRVDAEGREHYLTLACGLHARRHGKLNRWYIITPLRIGLDLRLVSEQRLPLTKDRLVAALEGRGQIFEGPREYRAAVDEALFRLGPRYEPLIELLIRLRQPQLSRKLDETMLSNALSEALPPLSPSLIEDVAASFRGLEDDREAMNDYRAAQADVAEFLSAYRTYAAIIVRRQAEEVRVHNSQYEHRAREIRQFRDQREALATDLQMLADAWRQAETELNADRAAERTLRDSPEMKSVETLRLSGEKRDERKREFDEAYGNEQHESDRHARAVADHATAEADVERRREEAAVALEHLRGAAAHADLPVAVAPVRESFDEACRQRGEAMQHLQRRNAVLDEASRRHAEAQREVGRVRGELESAREAARVADERLVNITDVFTRDALAWESEVTELKLDVEADWREAAQDWLGDRSPEFPFERAVREAHALRQSERLAERETASSRRRERAEERAVIEEELTNLEVGRQPEPPVPHTRQVTNRADRPGAPLWMLCAFREEISPRDRAGFEAAMEASGLLDAWLMPDGSLIDASGDAFLCVSRSSMAKIGDEGLHRVLTVESAAVPEAIVCDVLSRIGIRPEAGEAWVSADGRWANGPLRGAWNKPEAEFVGFTAREQARLRRIRQLEEEVARLDQALKEIDDEIAAIQGRLATLESERASAPSADGIREAAVARDTAEQIVHERQQRLGECDRHAAQALETLETRRLERDRDAEDLGLSEWRKPEALAALSELMHALRLRASEYWPAARMAADAKKVLQDAAERLEEATRRLEKFRDVRAAAERRFTEAESELSVLKATLGKTAEEVIARLHQVSERIGIAERRVKELQARHAQTDGDIRVKEEQIRAAEADRLERQRVRDDAIDRLRHLVASDFSVEADPSLRLGDAAWSASRAVELARRAEQILKETEADDTARAKSQTAFQGQLSRLHDQLGAHGYHPRAEAILDGVLLVKCPFQGQDRTMSALHQLLGEEVAHRSRMLDEREREVIENHLIGEVAKELQERIRAGEIWVADVSSELERRPTSSGIRLKFKWRVDPEGPPGLEEANRQLLRMAAAWSPAERKAIGEFLQNRIRAERSENEQGSWQEHLSQALDYRSWRRFDIERWQDGKWQRLTRRTYGTGSGGEKAMTLTVPQFAAAAAHYKSASELAPRLILLDEVFVGIDGETRAKLMGLLDMFDLDYVMTSEREWGCYASVPSLAIYQLASRPEVQAVHVTRWVWNGKEKKRMTNDR